MHSEHYLDACCWCSLPSQTLSATSWNYVAQEKNLSFCKTVTSLIEVAGFSRYFKVAVMRRSRRWESLALFVFRVSLLRSVRDQGRARVLLKLFSMWKQLQFQYDETVQEVPSQQKIVIDTKLKQKIPVANLTHSLQLSFLHWVKVILSEIGWAMARYKVNRWLLSLACGHV